MTLETIAIPQADTLWDVARVPGNSAMRPHQGSGVIGLKDRQGLYVTSGRCNPGLDPATFP